MKKKPVVVIVMPAYNAGSMLNKTVKDIKKGVAKEIIVVDDCSSDDTVARAKKLGLTVYEHKKNKGYGGNQKTCYAQALKRNPDCVIMLHPDYQYDSKRIPQLIKPILEGHYDIMLGSRIRTRREALDGGMPIYKYFSNRFLTVLENIILGLNLSEYHTGLRAYSKKVLDTLPFRSFSNDFVFDSQFLISSAYFGFSIGEIPVPVRYFPEASSINFLRSLKYGLSTLEVLVQFILAKMHLNKNLIFKAQAKSKQ
jgi:glycosyltransferase involved in cell wall biosynthesis